MDVYTQGGEELRYLKFYLRSIAMGEPYSYDDVECAHVVASLREALRDNAGALGSFWLGYTLKAQLQDAQGLALLRAWVNQHGGPTWWDEQWEPLVRKCAAPTALVDSDGSGLRAVATSAQRGRLPEQRSQKRFGLTSCFCCSQLVEPKPGPVRV